MTTTSFFLPFFNLKERHYNNPPANACNPFLSLTYATTPSVVEMLELVLTDGSNFIFTGFSVGSCRNVVTPFYLYFWDRGVEITTFITFSISKNLTYFRHIYQEALLPLNFLPSILYKREGWR